MNLTQNKIYILFIALFLGLSIIFSTNALAVPNLGVATGGIYAKAPEDSWGDLDYQDYFASGFVSGSEDNHGFDLGPSGSTLTIFTNILDYDIYLLTDTDAWNSSKPIKFDGTEFIEISGTEQADGYKPTPYYGLNLGKVDINVWELLPSNPFQPAPFYAYTAVIEYEIPFPFDSYFFAAADICDDGLHFNNSSGDWNKCSGSPSADPFSPKTDSTTPIPEPATVLLLGSGLIGLALAGFKRKIKR